jgi:hypothetical protein
MRTSEQGEERPQRLPVSEGGRDELNLAEFPITVLSDKVPKALKTLTFSDHIRDQATGEMVTRKVTISGSDIYGLPGPLDMDVLLCLIQITKLANNFTSPEVRFSRGELVRMLRLPDSGKHYRRIDESLRRWLGVTLYHDSSWWDKSAKEWSTNEGWHILEHIVIVDREVTRKRRAKGQLNLFLSSFTWNKIFFQSCQAENIKRLDLDTYFSLERAVSKRMFRFLDKRFYHRRDWTFDLKEFAFEHIGISRNYDVGEIKAKLRPAIDELEATGFLEPMSREERYRKVARGEWTITLVRASTSIEASPQPATAPPEPLSLASELAARGVTAVTAGELAQAFPPEHIQARIEAFDWLIAKKDTRVTKNPAGYLADSIRKGYAAPKGFETKAERERKQAAERERQRKAEDTKRRADAAEKAREEADQARIRAYLASLSPAEQEELEAAALATANPFFSRQYRQSREPELTARYLKLIIETHVSGILAERDKQAAH